MVSRYFDYYTKPLLRFVCVLTFKILVIIIKMGIIELITVKILMIIVFIKGVCALVLLGFWGISAPYLLIIAMIPICAAYILNWISAKSVRRSVIGLVVVWLIKLIIVTYNWFIFEQPNTISEDLR